MKYKKKPVIIEVIQFEDTAKRICELSEFMGGAHINYEDNNPYIPVETLEGTMRASVGEFYPCKPDIFEKTYEKV